MKNIFLLAFASIIFTTACTPKLAPSSAKDYISTKEAYTQKEIPGLPGGSIQDYLKLELDFGTDEEITIDEVVFRGKSYVLNAAVKTLRLNLAAGSIHKKETSLADNEAMIIYTYKGKNMVLTIRNIEEKPPIYLP